MRLRKRQLISPDLPNIVADIRSPCASPSRGISREEFDEEMEVMTDPSKGKYLRNVYFPEPLLFHEADYMSDSVLFVAAPWFNGAQLDIELLMNRYVTTG